MSEEPEVRNRDVVDQERENFNAGAALCEKCVALFNDIPLGTDMDYVLLHNSIAAFRNWMKQDCFLCLNLSSSLSKSKKAGDDDSAISNSRAIYFCPVRYTQCFQFCLVDGSNPQSGGVSHLFSLDMHEYSQDEDAKGARCSTY